MQWNDRLYTINPDTAQVYYLGQAEVPGPIHTLDIDSQGRLVAPTYNFFDPDDFWEVDPGTLNAVWLEDAPENISAMVFGADDVLFAVSGTSSVLYQVDLDHGTWSELLILDQLGDVEGMELIPETTAAALLAMAIPLVGRRVRRESVDTGAL